MKALVLKDLEVGYSMPLLPPLNINFKEGSFTILLGANGSGKSTLLKTLLGLLSPLSGDFTFNEISLSKLQSSKRKHIISAVFSSLSTQPMIRAWELVALSVELKNRKKRKEKALEAMRFFSCEYLEDKLVNHLSDGQIQKLMLARALAQNTPIMVLDEPTAFLDHTNKREAFSLMKSLAKEQNKIVIAATHDLALAREYTDKEIDINKILEEK